MERSTPNTPARTNSTIPTLLTLFFLWKSLLLLLAAASPGPGYDTSTDVLFATSTTTHDAPTDSLLGRLVARLTRWDAVYFTASSLRGHVFEQESAFSAYVARQSARVARVYPFTRVEHDLIRHAAAAIALSHLSHLGAVLVLYRLTRDIVPARRATQQRIAFTAASLHVLSPAGLFLSAPYGESAFALANFAGMLCYVTARRRRARGCGGVRAAGWDLAAGFLFGTASLIRSNGLLSGLVFAWDAVVHVSGLGSILRQRRWASLLQFAVTVLSGSFVAIGYALPQFEAYMRYCTGDVVRPWCGNWIPSVYSFVQSHYWNVGFLRYWTLSNLPLFALALPMIVVLVATSLVVLDGRQHRQFLGLITADERDSSESKDVSLHDEDVFWDTMRRFALPQAVLAILAVTSFHVQIINRISSGYPIWYIVLAIAIHAPRTNKVHRGVMGSLLANAGWLVRASVMYAIVQGGLYASFMPPA